jgi:hypothetical protein
MKTLFSKFGRVADAMAKDLGSLEFFGLIHRTDNVDAWDVVVASSALPANEEKAIDVIATYIEKVLAAKEMVHISQLVPVSPDNDIVRELIDDRSRGSSQIFTPLNRRFDRALIIYPKTPAYAGASAG